MSDLIDLVGRTIGEPVRVERQAVAAGDARRTGGSSDLAASVLDWTPATTLTDGVTQMVAWCHDQTLT